MPFNPGISLLSKLSNEIVMNMCKYLSTKSSSRSAYRNGGKPNFQK